MCRMFSRHSPPFYIFAVCASLQVFQLIRQFPTAFEFSADVLLRLAEEAEAANVASESKPPS